MLALLLLLLIPNDFENQIEIVNKTTSMIFEYNH